MNLGLNGFRNDSCGNVQFTPCMNCNGSRKVFDKEEDKSPYMLGMQ